MKDVSTDLCLEVMKELDRFITESRPELVKAKYDAVIYNSVEVLEADLAALYELRGWMNQSLSWFANPMACRMFKHSPLVVESLRNEIQKCDTRIRNIQAILPPKPILISLIKRPLPPLSAHDICGVQPMTRNNG